MVFVFFFKQKTAYEMRISDWSSDVCSSDLVFETMSRAIDSDETGISFGSQHVARPLLTPDEVRTLREDYQLLFLAGQRPIVAAKLKLYPARVFAPRCHRGRRHLRCAELPHRNTAALCGPSSATPGTTPPTTSPPPPVPAERQT